MSDRIESVAPEGSTDIARAMRDLALIDKVIGLEAEVARLSAQSPYPNAREEIEHLQRQLKDIQTSLTWRIGSVVLSPARLFRRHQ